MTTFSVDTARVRDAAASLRTVGGQTMGLVATTQRPAIDAASAGGHAGVAAAIADVFDAWLDSVGRGGATIERLGRVLADAAAAYTHVDNATTAAGGGRNPPI
jgi:hypothetical protein